MQDPMMAVEARLAAMQDEIGEDRESVSGMGRLLAEVAWMRAQADILERSAAAIRVFADSLHGDLMGRIEARLGELRSGIVPTAAPGPPAPGDPPQE